MKAAKPHLIVFVVILALFGLAYLIEQYLEER